MQFPYGELLTEIPNEFTPPEMWPEYGAVADPVPICKRELVQENPAAIRWSLWPLTFEQYWGDEEPNFLAASKGELARNRIVLWRRVRSASPLKGWFEAKSHPFRIDGSQTLEKNFIERWNKNARRDLRLWQERHEQRTHQIEEISFDEYASAYRKSLIAKREGVSRLNDLKQKYKYELVRAHTSLWGIRNHEGRIVAGSAVIHSPLYKSSTHYAPFIHEEGRDVYAATALINHWFTKSLEQGQPTVMTTNFWFPGQPSSWKGFSEFKSHFGWNYVSYPPLLWRFAKGKFI